MIFGGWGRGFDVRMGVVHGKGQGLFYGWRFWRFGGVVSIGAE